MQKKRGVAGKQGNGLRAIAVRYNSQYLTESDDRRLTRKAIYNCINERGEHGVSPPKRGKPFKDGHIKLTQQLALQAAMNQAAGAGEATSRMLKKSIVAATISIKHEGKFNANYVVASSRRLHQEVFHPVSALTNKD